MRPAWIGVAFTLAGCTPPASGAVDGGTTQASTASDSTSAATMSTGETPATASSGTGGEATIDAGTSAGASSGTMHATDAGTSTGAGSGTMHATTDAGSTDTTLGETSTDASSTGEAAWSGPCPAYSGLAPVGSTWNRSSTPQYEARTGNSYESDLVVTQVQDLGTHTRVSMVATIPSTSPDSSLTSVLTYSYRCDDDGAWLESLHQTVDGTVAGQPWSAWTDSEYQPPLLTMPWDVDVGSTWSASTTVVSTSSMGAPTQVDFSADYQVVGTATAHPPAGDFEGLVISWTDGTTTSSWIAHEQIGSVEVEGSSTELVAVDVLDW